MASRGRPRFDAKAKAAFKKGAERDTSGVHTAILKQARKSGQLNLSNRSLTEVPQTVWRINVDTPDECRNIALDNTDERWWDQVDLTKLILASNALTSLSEDIALLPALTVLDVHDNQLSHLPDALGILSNLQRINISHNQLVMLPETLSMLESLQNLQTQHNQLTSLPDKLRQMSALDDLDVSHNKLELVPPDIGYLRMLMRLNLSNNKLQQVPCQMGDLTALRQLDMSNNQLSSLPDELGFLRQLEQLYLRNNKLKQPPVLIYCSKLKELQLGNNQIEALGEDHLQCLTSLSVLELRDNKLSVLPVQISLLESLERMDVANNNLSGLPYEMGNMVNLKSVVLDGNPMKSIRRDLVMRGTMELKKYLSSRLTPSEPAPAPASKQQGVRSTEGTSGVIGGGDQGVDAHAIATTKTLNYSEKKATVVPDDVWSVAQEAKVTVVHLNKNSLTQCPPQLSLLSCLSELNLSQNKLTELSDSLSQCQQLRMLDVSANQLTSLPASLSSLTLMKEIIISFNRFREMPEVVYGWSQLEILLCSSNQVSEINVGRLKSLPLLAVLDLQNNSIAQVPPELGTVSQLRSLQLEGNAFRQPRPAILAKGTVAIMEYLKDRIPS